MIMKAVGFYILFALVMFLYLFVFSDSDFPQQYKGTSADPTTFMNEHQLVLSEEYSEIKNFLFFLNTPFEWLMYAIILMAGLSKKWEKSSLSITRFTIFQNAIYVFYLSVLSFAAFFPFQYISFYLAKKYHISNQTFSMWMKDELLDFWLGFLMTAVIVSVLYYLIKKSAKRWWVYLWLLSIPFMMFFMFLKPVVIDPLYNDFYPLKDKELEAKILQIAKKANIPAEHVFEVDMATKTNTMNAYVTGIGSNSRIVLWDTTLNKLDDDEILFIMAHEMGHYVKKHIYYGIVMYAVAGFAGLWLTAKIMEGLLKRRGKQWGIASIGSLSSLPLFLCILSVLSFASSPISNAVSRYEEKSADEYAIEMVKDSDAAVKTFQELSKTSLSQIHPPILVKLFRYTHPTMLERISMLESYSKEMGE
ncbi:M48 family metallopeptidase [Bacillus sp. 1P06AnD]|uniref:M48 family metallopeptidase n=1 Tax=Bacillus sp. 1P06AnD TaxID=3132208 RepID=UPI0039A26945